MLLEMVSHINCSWFLVQFSNQRHPRSHPWSKEGPVGAAACCGAIYVCGDLTQDFWGRFYGVGNLVSWNERKVSVSVSDCLVTRLRVSDDIMGKQALLSATERRSDHSAEPAGLAMTGFMLGFQPNTEMTFRGVCVQGNSLRMEKGATAAMQRISCFSREQLILWWSPPWDPATWLSVRSSALQWVEI